MDELDNRNRQNGTRPQVTRPGSQDWCLSCKTIIAGPLRTVLADKRMKKFRFSQGPGKHIKMKPLWV